MIPTFPDLPVTVTYARALSVTGSFRGFDRNSKGQPAVVIESDDSRWPTRYTIAVEQMKQMAPAEVHPGGTADPAPVKRTSKRGAKR